MKSNGKKVKSNSKKSKVPQVCSGGPEVQLGTGARESIPPPPACPPWSSAFQQQEQEQLQCSHPQGSSGRGSCSVQLQFQCSAPPPISISILGQGHQESASQCSTIQVPKVTRASHSRIQQQQTPADSQVTLWNGPENRCCTYGSFSPGRGK